MRKKEKLAEENLELNRIQKNWKTRIENLEERIYLASGKSLNQHVSVEM